MAQINPIYSIVEVVHGIVPVTALVPAARIKLDLPNPEVPRTTTWLTISPVVPPRHTALRLWRGSMRFTAFAPHMHTAQQIIDTLVDEMWDELMQFKRFDLLTGSQAGAVVSVVDVFNLTRTRTPLSGDVYEPSWAVDLDIQVSMGVAAWAS